MPFDDAIDSDPFQAHLDRGWELLNRGDAAGALVSAKKTVELDEESPDAHNLLGYALAARGQAEEALEHYQQAISLDDTFVDPMLNAADLLLRPGGDPKEALALIEDALDLLDEEDDEGEFADALLLKADTLMMLDREEDAKKVLGRIPEASFERNPMLSFMAGRAYVELDAFEEAAPRLEQAAAKITDSADLYYYLALLREKQQDGASAAQAFLCCRQLDLREPPMPWSMPYDQFEKVVQELVASVPALPKGLFVHISDLPGAEAVMEGVDPRAALLLDAACGSEDEEGAVARQPTLFVYQRNIERAAEDLAQIRDVLGQALQYELDALKQTKEEA